MQTRMRWLPKLVDAARRRLAQTDHARLLPAIKVILRGARMSLAPAVLLLLVLSLAFQASERYPHAIDETNWMTSGLRTFRLVQRLAGPSEWASAYERLGDFGNKNPPLGKLFFGGVIAAVIERGQSFDYVWAWPLTYGQNLALGNLPPYRVLLPVRVAVALCGGALLVVLYLEAFVLTRRAWMSLIAPLTTFLMPVFAWTATHVYTDVPQLLLAAVGQLAFLRYLRRRRCRWLGLSAAMLGLSCAVKFSSAPFVMATAMTVFALGGQGWWTRAWRTVAFCLVAAAAFVVVNPYLYPAPVRLTYSIVQSWAESKRREQADPLLAAEAVTNPIRGIECAARGAIFAPHLTPIHYTRQLDRIAPSALTGAGIVLLLVVLHRSPIWLASRRRRADASVLVPLSLGGVTLLAFSALGAAVTNTQPNAYSVLTCLGLLCLVSRRISPSPVRTYLRLTTAGVFLVVALWLPFDWARYYLPVIVTVAPLQAVGLAEACRWFEAAGGSRSRPFGIRA